VWCSFEGLGLEGEARPVQATFFGEEPRGAELPEAWSGWRQAAMRGGQTAWSRAKADRRAGDSGHPALCGRGDGTRLVIERMNGERLTVFGWTDSTGVAAEWAVRGWSWGDSLPWARIMPDGLHVGTGTWAAPGSASDLPPVDEWAWSLEEGYREATALGAGRMAWTGSRTPEGVASLMAEATPSQNARAERTLGRVRNHRSGKRMDVRWVEGTVKAYEGEALVWSVAVGGALLGGVEEVDLYRNNKYQCAFATTEGLHVIDVLGREVKGFPIEPTSGVSAWLLADYDRSEQYRFLVATPNGMVLNYRGEGERTPGWNFKPTGEAIAHLAHLRIGSKDYLFAGQTDGHVRLLSRTGNDRATTDVHVPPTAPPAFRLGGSIAGSTVLYIGTDGWVEERTLGTNEPVGMDRLTRGVAVATEDVDGDGKAEVVVTDAQGARSIWNQRNERISSAPNG